MTPPPPSRQVWDGMRDEEAETSLWRDWERSGGKTGVEPWEEAQLLARAFRERYPAAGAAAAAAAAAAAGADRKP